MFGGYLSLKRQEEDNLRVEHRLRTAYHKLREIDEKNFLLTLMGINDDSRPSSRPDICPIRVEIRLTPKLVEKYRINWQSFDQRMSIFGWQEEFIKYVTDLEAEVQKFDNK